MKRHRNIFFDISLCFILCGIALLGCAHVAGLDDEHDANGEKSDTDSTPDIIGYDADSNPIYDTDTPDIIGYDSDSNPIYDTDTPDIIGYDSDSNPIYDTASTDDSPDSERPAIDYCLSLDGDGDFVRVFSSGDVAVVENWTTEAWVKFYRNTNWDSQPVLRLGEGATTSVGSYFLYARYYESLYGNLPMGGYGYSGSSFNTLFGNEALVDGEWTHLAFVYTSDKQQFFVNGELQVEQYFQNSAYELRTDNLIIGAIEHPQLTGYFDGCIDNVRISNTIRYADKFTPPTELYPDDYTLALWTFTGEETGIFLDATGRLEAEFVGDAEIIEK